MYPNRRRLGEAESARGAAWRESTRGHRPSRGRWDTYLAHRERFEPPGADEHAVSMARSGMLDRAIDAAVSALFASVEQAAW
ncbi:MAG: hypothetical protein ACYDEB_08835 [Dehalococcoidia bacterium]